MGNEDIRARIEAKRKAQADDIAPKRAAQEKIDLEAYEAAGEKYGFSEILCCPLARYVEGLPTFLVLRAAPADNVTIHRQRVLKSRKDKGGLPDPIAADNAIAELGRACIVYPDRDGVEAIKQYFPTVEKDAGIKGRDLSQMREEEEGKG